MMVAKADCRRKDDGDIGEDRAQPVGVGLLEHDVVRVIVDQHEQRMIGEGAKGISGDDDRPPRRVKHGQHDANGDLHCDQQHGPQRRPRVAAD
jgi:hypothetical protein